MHKSSALALARWLLALLLIGCNLNRSSGKSDADEVSERSVKYDERVSGIHKLVYLGLERCTLVVNQGPQNGLLNKEATCSTSELQRAQELVSSEAWASYAKLTPADLQIGGVEPSAGGSGSGGSSSLLHASAPDAGETSCVGPGCPAEATGDTGQIPSTDTTQIDGTVSVSMDNSMKVFWANSTGPERELIDFFRALHDKYGQFETVDASAP